LAIGIILLFLTICISPIINADGNSIPQTRSSVPITILEYKADRTIERTVFRLSREQVDSFHEEMRNAQDLDTRLSIYKKYNLISQDVTVDSLRVGMEKKAKTMGLTPDDIMSQFRSNRSLFPPFIRRNIFCTVWGDNCPWYGFCFPPIPRDSGVPRLGMFFFITDCSLASRGFLGKIYLLCFFVILVGFVGIIEIDCAKWPYICYDGFCVYVKGVGIPV
jgi:hypothetical protein